MYPRLLSFHKRTMSSTASVISPFKNHSPYGGLLVAGLFGLFGIKVVKNKLEKKKLERYGCNGHPKKYISKTLKKDEIVAGVTGEC